MGITISSNNYAVDMGYGGFMNFRKRVAMCQGDIFGEHYFNLQDSMMLFDESDRDKFFDIYDKKTNDLVENGNVSDEIANFCYQADVEGEIDQEQAAAIYEVIKDYDDNLCYGYSGRDDCAMFSDLKIIFKDCADNGGVVEWS